MSRCQLSRRCIYKDCGKAGFITRRAMMLRDLGALRAAQRILIMQASDAVAAYAPHQRQRVGNSPPSGRIPMWLCQLSEAESSRITTACRGIAQGRRRRLYLWPAWRRERGARLIDSLELIMHVTNVGDARTLINHPATTQAAFRRAIAESGIRPETVRLSVGLEDPPI
ncbi:MAG: PLP-dependent transferase [Merdibacter sp.]